MSGKAKSSAKSRSKSAGADARGANEAARKPVKTRAPESVKQLAAEPAPSLTRKDVRALQDAVTELRQQTSVLDELARGLRKQVKRLKKVEPAKRGRAPTGSGAIDDGAPSRPLARALGAIRRGVQSTRDRVKRG